MRMLEWITGIGTPWLIACAFVAGAIASLVYVERFMPTFGRMLRDGCLMCAFAFGGYAVGFSEARDACQVQAVQTRLDKALMDLTAAKKAAAEAASSAEQLTAAEARNQELVDALANQPRPPDVPEVIEPQPGTPPAPALPHDVCSALSPTDVGRLLRIR